MPLLDSAPTLNMFSDGSSADFTFTPEQFNEYIIVFEGNAVACILIGVYFVIAGMNLYLLQRRKTYRILLLFTIAQLTDTILFTIMALYMGPGRALAAFDIVDRESSDVAPNSLSAWPAIVLNAIMVFNTCISDAFLLYRCYHIIRLRNRYGLIFPVLLYVATIGSSLAWLVANSNPGASYSSPAVQLTGICYMSLTSATNITATSLIISRLWMYRREICDAMGSQQGTFYMSYIAMTLESALLYTVFTIITLIVFALKSPLDFAFIAVWGVVAVIAPSMIIYRIACGISFEAGEDGSVTIGSIRFASISGHPVSRTHSVHDQVVSDRPNTTLVSSSANRAEEDHLFPEQFGIQEVRRKVH